jgi:hypothetical protein
MVELAKTDGRGRFHGVTYDPTKDNSLDRDWLVQTPHVWGRRHRQSAPSRSTAGETATRISACRSATATRTAAEAGPPAAISSRSTHRRSWRGGGYAWTTWTR